MIEAAVLAGLLVVTIVVVLALVSARMSATSQPTEQEILALTSGAPGEAMIDYRICNALIADAVADIPVLDALGSRGRATTLSASLNWASRSMGGLWVGGRAFLTSHRFVFMPNDMNRALHKDLRTIAVDLKDIVAVTDRFGLVTRIIDIQTHTGVLSIRSPDARAFAHRLRAGLGRR
jgi:hypothetical protein